LTSKQSSDILAAKMSKRLKPTKEMRKYLRAIGAEGGKERAKRLSPQQRSEIAKKAVQARESRKAAKVGLVEAKQKPSS
jgi:predicted DsbA family dithiol-disulfide isomerase